MDEYVARDGAHGYLYGRESQSSGGVLMLPHAAGIRPEIRRDARLLADEGFTTFLWDPYPGWDSEADGPAAADRPSRPAISDEGAITANGRCLRLMLDELRIAKVAVIGYCMGGRMALNLAARDRRIAVCVAYYPTLLSPRRPHQLDPADEIELIACPVQVVYGGRDDVTSNTSFIALRVALDRTGHPTMVHIYPDAGHGFMNDRNQLIEANRTATRLAWPQSLALLKATLFH